ncbi:MAG: DUF2142 domain-containing protein [Acidobacteria bacterium]|nr:DUF2142 domain-containing protein [Acidobacteriota bacterium]MCB9397888.1 DUF2142 domain-containing protein [Acidobacteriota bacterium]
MFQQSFFHSPVRIFQWLLCPFLLVYSLLVPPWQVPDEPIHFVRAWMFSCGRFRADLSSQGFRGTEVPIELTATLDCFLFPINGRPEAKVDARLWWRAFVEGKKTEGACFYRFHNPMLYGPTVYLPQIIAIWLCRLFSPSLVFLLWCCRLSTLCVAAFLIRAALLKAEATGLDWFFLIVAGMPMTLTQLASCSADALTISLAFYWISDCWACRLRTLTGRDRLRLSVLASALLLGKMGYVFLPLFAAICWRPWLSRQALGSFVSYLGAVFLPSLLWAFWVHVDYFPSRHFDAVWIQPAEQWTFLFQHPQVFCVAVWRALFQYGGTYGMGIVGVLGWLETPLPKVVYGLFGLMLGWSILRGSDLSLSRFERGGIAFLLVGSIGYLFLATYLTWNPVGNIILEGIQGRYFIPLLPLMPAFFPKTKLGKYMDDIAVWVPVGLIACQFWTCATLLKRFWL